MLDEDDGSGVGEGLDTELLVVMVWKAGRSFVVPNIYHSPSIARINVDSLDTVQCELQESESVIWCGDLNAKSLP